MWQRPVKVNDPFAEGSNWQFGLGRRNWALWDPKCPSWFATMSKQGCSKTDELDKSVSRIKRPGYCLGAEGTGKSGRSLARLEVLHVSQHSVGASRCANLCQPCLSSSGSLLEVMAVGGGSGKQYKISEKC